MISDHSLSLFDDAATKPALLGRRDHLTFKANNGKGRHGWLRLTPAYSLHLVESLVAQCRSRDLVLDPFCGTGTTALVCSQAGISCQTVDINPFLVWLARAKCAAYSEHDIAQAESFLNKALQETLQTEVGRWIPALHEIEKWWNRSDLLALAHLFEMLSSPPISELVGNLLKIAFCRVAIQLANVSFGHQSMSFRKGKDSLSLFQDHNHVDMLKNLFRRAFTEVAESARVSSGKGSVGMHLGDSRNLDQVLKEHSFTTVITSPPYPNRMSYIRELRPYMYWLGYLSSGRQAGDLDWKAIGGTWGCATSNLMKWEPDKTVKIPHRGFKSMIKGIESNSSVLARYVHKYFEDAVLHIHSLKKVLAGQARIHYVVGNSKFYDVMVPVEEIYADIFRSVNFEKVRVEKIRKRTSKKELYEYVVSAVA